jgi:hypothetical protein
LLRHGAGRREDGRTNQQRGFEPESEAPAARRFARLSPYGRRQKAIGNSRHDILPDAFTLLRRRRYLFLKFISIADVFLV